MIPIWAKDRNGKWEVFPAHLLETLVDGSQGFKFDDQMVNYQGGNYGDRSAAFRKFREYFEDNPLRKQIGWLHPLQYRLKNQEPK